MNVNITPSKYVASLTGIFKRRKVEPITSGERERALVLQAEWDRRDLHRQSVANDTYDRARDAAADAYSKDQSDANWSRLNQVIESKQEIMKRHRELRAHAEAGLKRFTKEDSIPFVLPIFRRIAKEADAHAATIEAEDRVRHEDDGTPWEPSQPALSARQKATNLRARADFLEHTDVCSESPRSLLAEAGIDL